MVDAPSTNLKRRKRRGRRVRWFWLVPGVLLIFLRIFYPALSKNWTGLVTWVEASILAPEKLKEEAPVIYGAAQAQKALDEGLPAKAIKILDEIGPAALQFGNWPATLYVRAYLAQDNIEKALYYFHLFNQKEVPEDLQHLMRPYQERFLVKRRGTRISLKDVTAESGINFLHHQCSPQRLESLYETIGSGVALVDFDEDGLLDLFFTSGMNAPPEDGVANRLYKNLGDGFFQDVTGGSGLGYTGFSYGVCCGDLNGDRLPELYIGNNGPNRLYENLGGMRFKDITEAAGVTGNSGCTTAVGFADLDGDGDLDLYAANWASPVPNSGGVLSGIVYRGLSRRSVFSPFSHKPQRDQLFRNNGDMTFTDISEQAGVVDSQGRGLGLALCDFNNDGLTDIFVANDMSPNRFYLNRGNGTFEDRSSQTRLMDSRASMGVAVTDFNNDDYLDLFYTNYKTEYNAALFNRMKEHGDFSEQTEELNLRAGTLGVTSWGTVFPDLDNDGDQDLVVANGLPEPFDEEGYEPNPLGCILETQLVYKCKKGRFTEVTRQSGSLGNLHEVGRGLVEGDFDRDGQEDVVLSTNNGPAYLLRNQCKVQHHWLEVRPRWKAPNRLAVGARITIEAGGKVQRKHLQSGTSYLSQGPFEVHFGLREAGEVARLTVTWPDRTLTVLEHVQANQMVTVDWEELEGKTAPLMAKPAQHMETELINIRGAGQKP